MKRVLLIFSAFIAITLLTSNIPDDCYMSVLDLRQRGKLRISGTGRGGYNSTCLSVNYSSIVTDTVYGSLEPGTIFISDDPKAQDILITRIDRFVAVPKKSGELVAWGYCCRAHRAGPLKGNKFGQIKRANDTLLKLARYLNTNYYSITAEQHAVWVISDGNPVASIPEGEKRENVPLRKKVCELIGEEYPWYTVEYESGNQPFSNKPKRVYGEIAYQIANGCMVDAVLYNEDGTTLKVLMQGVPKQPGRYVFWFDEKKIFKAGQKYTLKFFYDRAERMSSTISL
jgi:hypothetical protein